MFPWRLLQKNVGYISCTLIKIERDIAKLASTSFDPVIDTFGECSFWRYEFVVMELGQCQPQEASC